VFKWWEAEELPDGQKWKTLVHRGPMFPPEYETLPKSVHILYDGKPFPLEPASEEIAAMYAAMLRTEYIGKEVFNKVRLRPWWKRVRFCSLVVVVANGPSPRARRVQNFMGCWREAMTKAERGTIKDIKLCDFTKMQAHLDAQSAARKAATKEERATKKEKEVRARDRLFSAACICHIDRDLISPCTPVAAT
jgi:DNA topoisomerase-1